MEDRKIDNILVKHDLTEEDRAEYSDTMAAYVERIEDLDEDKKSYTANMNKQIKDVQAELSTVAEHVRRGWIEKKVDCYLVFDYPKGKVRYYRLLTGEFVQIRDIKQNEAQGTFDFEGGDLDPVAEAFRKWGPHKDCWKYGIPFRTVHEVDLDRIEECWFMEYADYQYNGLDFSFVDGLVAA